MAKFNSVKKKFVLNEINDYSAIHTPLKSRIKYTSFDVSQSFIVLGATSGGLYVFRREPCTFLQLLPNKEGPITNLLLSPDEKLIAFATERSVVCVVERTEGGGARLLNRSVEHAGSRITALQWVHTSDQLFIGDNLGRLSVINVSLFMSKNIFQIPAFIFMQLDSSVVQISCHDDMILVSTTSHSYVCDTTKEQYRQIGTKLRDGEYGACYNGEKIYCARPGSRLWEVDLEGTVQSTHQFKQALAVEPALIVSETQDGCIHKRRPPSDEWPQQSFNFAKLSVIGKFLFTFKQDGVYVFNPETVDVVLWSDRYRDIIDAKCFDDTIYIWTKSQKVHALTLVTLDKCLLRTYFRERYKLCHSLVSHFTNHLLESPEILTSLNPLINLSNFVDCDESVSKVLKAIEAVVKNKDNYTQLESGIYLVDNHHARQKLLFEGRKVDGRLNGEQLKINNKIRNPRSHSLPPDAKMRQKVGGSVPSVSASSLPELMKRNLGENGTNDFCGGLNRDQKHPIILAPHLHFLPLSSPDIIHDALIEIGHNMSGKLMNGTKTLKDKWQVLEGKLKFSKVDNTFQKMKSNEVIRNNMNKTVNGVTENGERSTNGEVLPNGNINGEAEEEEEIVIGRKLISNNNSGFVANEILNLCHKLEGLENGRSIDDQLLDAFFETVLTTYKKYVEFVSNNSRKNKTDIKYFPFNQFLPEKYVGVVQSVFQNSLRSGEVIKRVTSFHNNSCLSALAVQELNHPTIFSEVYPVHVLTADVIFSQILVIFSEVLDPYSILQDLDGLVDLPCRYLSWCAVMDRFQEGALQYFTKESYNSVNVGCRDWPLPLLLNAMFLLLRLDQVEPAVEMGRQGNVPLHLVSHVILKLNSHLAQSSSMSGEEIEKKCSNMFLSFITKFCDKNEVTIEKIDLNDRGLLSHLEKCLILVNKDLEYSVCRCGFPRPPPNKFSRKGWRKLKSIKYPDIGKILLAKFWEKRDEPGHVKPDLISHTDGIKELCKLNGEQDDENFWSLIGNLDYNLDGVRQTLRPGLSESIQHLKKICSVVPPLLLWFLSEKLKDNPRSAALFNIKTVLILQLGALEDLEHRNDPGCWAQIVELYGKISRGECCFCGRRVSADSVNLSDDGTRLAMEMLRSLGAKQAMAILRQYVSDLPHFMLNKEFYQACILSGLVDSRVEGCRKQVIEEVTIESSMFPLSSSAATDLLSALTLDTDTDLSHRLQSETNHAWGVTVDTHCACALCSLRMRTPQLTDSRLRAFSCGHAFHVVCLRAAKRALVCPLCTS